MNKFRSVFFTAVLAVITPVVAVSQSLQQPKSEDLDMEKLLGKTSYSSIKSPQNFKGEGIDLQKGRPMSEGMTLKSAMELGKLTPEEALKAVGKKLDLEGPLSQIESLKNISLENLVAANPEISNLKASAVGWIEKGEATLAEVAASDIGKFPLPDNVLKQAKVGEFGNIAKTPIGSYPGADKMTLDKLPELANTPIAKIMSPTTSGPNIRMMRVNKVFTGEKNGRQFSEKVVSGSDQRPKAQWGKSSPVGGVELIDAMNSGKDNLANGSVAITGNSLMIPGGNVPSPNQPTALPIPGTPLAMSFESPNETTGDAKLQLNMRLEYGLGMKTSYFIPIPTPIKVSEKSKTALVPTEFDLPNSIANKPNANMATSTGMNSEASSNSNTNTVGEVKIEQPSDNGTNKTQSEVKIAKANDIGSAVKGATDPVTGVVY